MSRGVVGFLLLFALAGCGALDFLNLGAVDTSNPVRIDRASLLENGRSVRLDFVGGREYARNDPCSVDYVGQASIHGDRLDVAVYRRIHPTAVTGVACVDVGYTRSVTVELSEAFHGSVIRDLTGQDFPVP